MMMHKFPMVSLLNNVFYYCMVMLNIGGLSTLRQVYKINNYLHKLLVLK